MAYGKRAAFEPIREIAFGGIGAAYAVLGDPTIDYTRLITITSTLDAEIYISFDGVEDHLRIPVATFDKTDITANQARLQPIFLPKNTQIYIKQVTGAPQAGACWVSIMYAQGGV